MTTVATHPNHPILHHDPKAAATAVALMEEEELREAKKRRARSEAAFVAGRLMIAAVFIASAVLKAVTFRETSNAMYDFGLSATDALLSVAIGIELIGGALLAIGWKVKRAAQALAAWLVIITVFIYGNLTVASNVSWALANAAIIGGLLLLAAHGAGNASLDKLLQRRAAAREG